MDIIGNVILSGKYLPSQNCYHITERSLMEDIRNNRLWV